MVALFVVVTIVAFLLADAVVLWVRRRRAFEPAGEAVPLRELLPEPDLPGGVFLSPNHLWVGLLPAGQARIGFDPLVLAAMGNPDRVDGPRPGAQVKRGDPLFSAHWGTRSVLFASPMDGTVQSACPPAGILDEEGWVVTVEPAHAGTDLGLLPLAEGARQWFAQEWGRLRDFVAAQSLQAVPAMSLPDGGSPAPGWLKLEPDGVWDRFVESFLVQREGMQ
jgi:hypothetical protein